MVVRIKEKAIIEYGVQEVVRRSKYSTIVNDSKAGEVMYECRM